MGADQNQSGKKDVLEMGTTVVTGKKRKCGCPAHYGLPVLPVVFGNFKTNLNSSDQNYFAHPLAPTVGATNALSSLPEGYLYLYEELTDEGQIDRMWTMYRMRADGTFTKAVYYNLQDYAPTDPVAAREEYEAPHGEPDDKPKMACKISGHTHSDKFISIDLEAVSWLCFSHVELSKEVLRTYQRDTAMRDKRMQKFEPKKKDKNVNTSILAEYTEIEPVFRSAYSKKTLNNAELDQPVGSMLFSNAPNDAQTLLGEMQVAIDEGKRGEYLPVMVALPDPVGMTMAANAKRNYLIKALDNKLKQDGIGKREQLNSILVDNFRKTLADKHRMTDEEYDAKMRRSRSGIVIRTPDNELSQVSENIYDYIDRDEFERVLKAAKNTRKEQQDIRTHRQHYLDCWKQKDFTFILANDFILDDQVSATSLTNAYSKCITGIGINEENIGIPASAWHDYKPNQETSGASAFDEFEQVIKVYLEEKTPIEENWLIKVLSDLQTDAFEKNSDFNKLDRASEAFAAGVLTVSSFYEGIRLQKVDEQRSKVTAQQGATNRQGDKLDTAKGNLAEAHLSQNKLNDLLKQRMAYKASVITTLTYNMNNLWKSSPKKFALLNIMLHGSIYQSTGYVVVNFLTKNKLDDLSALSQERLAASLHKLRPYPGLLPETVPLPEKPVNQKIMGFSVDVEAEINTSLTGQDVFDRAAKGNNADLVRISTFVDKDVAANVSKIDPSISETRASLAAVKTDIEVLTGKVGAEAHAMDTAKKELERAKRILTELELQNNRKARLSAHGGILLSAGVGFMQMGSFISGTKNYSTIMKRNDRMSRQFISAYSNTVLTIVGAGADATAGVLKLRGAASSLASKLAISAGLIGIVAVGFEVISLEESKQMHKDEGSKAGTRAALGAQLSATGAAVATAALIMGASVPIFGAILAVAWIASIGFQWWAHRNDRSRHLPIHYWLDSGLFGRKEMLTYRRNPFLSSPKGFLTLEEDLLGFQVAMAGFGATPALKELRVNSGHVMVTGTITVTAAAHIPASQIILTYEGEQHRTGQTEPLGHTTYTLKKLLADGTAKLDPETGVLTVVLRIDPKQRCDTSMFGRTSKIIPEYVRDAHKAQSHDPFDQHYHNEEIKIKVEYLLDPSKHPRYTVKDFFHS